MVTEGRIARSGDTQARLLRDGAVVHEGKIGSLRRFKDDVSEVKAGFECGIGFEKFNDIKVGDVIEAFVVERVAATAEPRQFPIANSQLPMNAQLPSSKGKLGIGNWELVGNWEL